MGNEQSVRRTGLRDQELAVLKANTGASESKLKEFYEEFQRECPSGRMNKSQFGRFYQALTGGEDRSGQFAGNAFNVFDKNGDGTVDFTEFVLALTTIKSNQGQANSKQVQEDNLDLAFEFMDTSGDGRVSYNEVVKFVQGASRIHGTRDYDSLDPRSVASVMFSACGLRTDETISRRQFVDACNNNSDVKRMLGL